MTREGGIYSVFHATAEARARDHGRSWVDEKFLTFPDDHELVAEVWANDLEEVYMLTNHIDNNWTENQDIRELFIPRDRCRSTSVGDVVQDQATGRVYQVAGLGFNRIR